MQTRIVSTHSGLAYPTAQKWKFSLQPSLDDRCRGLLTELGISDPNDTVCAEALTGGVASDIARANVGGQDFCIKFALAKLKVAADWFAPVHRNAAEYAWLETAARIAPESAVRLFGRSETQHGFVMEYLAGDDVYLWKTHLLEQAPDHGEAARVGALIGKVHAASTKANFNTAAFQNRDDFQALRIEPYLTYTASRHPDISERLNEIAQHLYRSNQVLVHGDVSPKNILFRSTGPVILDAECATMGDASFDPAFCMNHLILKAIHLPASRERYLKNAIEFWSAYEEMIDWESKGAVEARICGLVPALMLARVDGKSPVEYLTKREGNIVRNVSRHFIKSPEKQLQSLIRGIGNQLKELAG